MDQVHLLAVKAAEAVNSHPVAAAVSGIAASAVSILQSSQQVASTLIAFVTSIAGLITAVLAVRNAWRARKPKRKQKVQVNGP